MQHAAQLLGLPIGLGWHAAEDDLLAIIIAGLRNEHLEGPHLIAAHRPHMTGIDGQRDRLHVCWRWKGVGGTIASRSSLAPTCNVRR